MTYEPYVYAGDMRALEAHAVQNGQTYAELMEHAGGSAAHYLLEKKLVSKRSSVLVLCGTGNNGGDGYVMARVFAQAFSNATVTVLAVGGKPQTAVAQAVYESALQCTNVKVLELHTLSDLSRCFDELRTPTLVIDAVYGIGFHGTLPSLVAELFDRVRQFRAFTVAVDLPSGMQADNDGFDPHCLQADLTLTFTAKKRCMLLERSLACCGDVIVRSVGISHDLVEQYHVDPIIITEDMAAAGVPVRLQHSHKGTFGQVLSLCGNYGMAGAAMLSGKAALRCGIGLLHMFVAKSIYPIAAGQLWEAVYHPLEETTDNGLSLASVKLIIDTASNVQKGAFLCGPGLSRNKRTASLVRKLLPSLSVPLVIDADGLNAYIGHIHEWKAMSETGKTIVITPHPAEAARLLACTVDEIERDRIASARRLAALSGATVVLKGHHTVIANDDRIVYINKTGCSGLAKGGSGDVLAGMIAAFAAQGIEALQACITAVYLHGLASVRTADRLSETGMLPTDLLDELPILLSNYEKRE